jgi:hypothetical protein
MTESGGKGYFDTENLIIELENVFGGYAQKSSTTL